MLWLSPPPATRALLLGLLLGVGVAWAYLKTHPGHARSAAGQHTKHAWHLLLL